MFLRTHPVVLDALMNVTRGDYARFNSNTYLEVYDEIVAQSKKEYTDEAASHEETRAALQEEQVARKGLEDRIFALETEKEYSTKEFSAEIQGLKEELKRRDDVDLGRKVKFLGWVMSIALFGVPYAVLIAITELLKAQYSDISFISIISIIVLLVVGVVALFLFKKGKTWCFSLVRKKLTQDKITTSS